VCEKSHPCPLEKGGGGSLSPEKRKKRGAVVRAVAPVPFTRGRGTLPWKKEKKRRGGKRLSPSIVVVRPFASVRKEEKGCAILRKGGKFRRWESARGGALEVLEVRKKRGKRRGLIRRP